MTLTITNVANGFIVRRTVPQFNETPIVDEGTYVFGSYPAMEKFLKEKFEEEKKENEG